MARGDGREGPNSELYRSAEWKKVRRFVLERDNWECKIKGKRCLHKATEVDHIVPLRDGGPRFDPEGLRAACKPCNAGRRTPKPIRVAPSRHW